MPRKSEPPAERYRYVARWCDQRGWIEVGHEWQDKLFARALHGAVLAWGGTTIDHALRALDDGIRDFIEENGWE